MLLFPLSPIVITVGEPFCATDGKTRPGRLCRNRTHLGGASPPLQATGPPIQTSGVGADDGDAVEIRLRPRGDLLGSQHELGCRTRDAITGVSTYLFSTPHFRPDMALRDDTTYRFTVSPGVRDLMGNPFDADYNLTFSTGATTMRPMGTGGTGGMGSGGVGNGGKAHPSMPEDSCPAAVGSRTQAEMAAPTRERVQRLQAALAAPAQSPEGVQTAVPPPAAVLSLRGSVGGRR